MAFIAIYTPRTASKRPAIVMPQAQLKNRGAVKQVMREAELVASKIKGSEAAWKPIKLANAIGALVPVRLDTGVRVNEIYLLCGIDTAKVDEETLRSVQSRLASQTSATADGLITTGIPWAHRNEAAYQAQFSGDFVLRNELGSYAMMFPQLPELPEFKASQSQKRNKWINWGVVLLIPLIATAAYFIYTKSGKAPVKTSSIPEKPPAVETPAPTPQPTATPSVVVAPKPIVMPDPYEKADLTDLEKALIELKEMRERLMREKETAANTPESLIRWEREAIRYNRRRQQLIRAFGRINTEGGQSALEPIFIEEYGVDLYAYPERMVKAREDLEKVRAELVDRGGKIDTSNLSAVEEYNDAVEWFNLRAEAFNRAVERAKTWGPPPAPLNTHFSLKRPLSP